MKKSIAAGFCLPFAFVDATCALETAPGDYEPVPAGKTALLMYYQHARSASFYRSGHRVSDDFRLRSDMGLLRLVQSVPLSDGLYWEPQAILPFGHLRTGGDARVLGNESGVGDLNLGSVVKIRLPTRHGDMLGLGVFVQAPTGSYDRDDALNLGENRWRLVLQGAYVHHFDERWSLDTVADVSGFSRNDDFGPNGSTQRQKARYEYQTFLRYQWAPATSLGIGGGYVTGARSSVAGDDQGDELRTSYARLTLTHFLVPDVQVQVQLGRDMAVEQGFKERGRLNLRLVKLF
ncbi:transporter [Pseudomonas sessilinigenes]|uniref:Transporter n=1 Tax=Pseudomonas sessilinigenes TaxID=658629 RepID=A0ABX8MPI1_9PSED|nr:transporter [Pseudomonas sessilinigenes]AZC25905.1 hypothetical protein C4K39_4247 [Pseudomonas sessilinigenes]QXH40059.1 transporter [Pseudomonas sessilinigenes]